MSNFVNYLEFYEASEAGELLTNEPHCYEKKGNDFDAVNDIDDIICEAIEIEGLDNMKIIVKMRIEEDGDFVCEDSFYIITKTVRTKKPSKFFNWRRKKPHIFGIDKEASHLKVEECKKLANENETAYERMYSSKANHINELDSKIMSCIANVDSAYRGDFAIEELKEKTDLKVCEENGKWVVYQKVCYYGGCDFDPKSFETEYDAYKHACIITQLRNTRRREHELSGATTKLADVNDSCPKYCECSGMDC